MYNTAATIRQGAKTDTDVKVLEAKPSLNWTGPYKFLAVDPCSSADTPDGSPLGAKLLYLDLPSDMPARTTLRPLCQPPPWRYAEAFASGVDAMCA